MRPGVVLAGCAFKQDVPAAYNAGKFRVDNWLTYAAFEEPAEFIESIPFTETCDYVQIVMRNADVYRRLYGAKQTAVLSSNGH